MRAMRLLLLAVLLGMAVTLWQPAVQGQGGALTLGISVNRPTIVPGDTLVAGVTVNNPGGGPLADFYFLILLPDGSTMVSAGPGATVRAATTSTATRSVTTVGAGVVITGTFRHDPGLTSEPPLPGFNTGTNAWSNQAVCFNLPGPFLATYSVQTSGQGDPTIFGGATLRLQSGATERFADGGQSGSIVLPASPSACISFSGYPWACHLNNGQPVCDRPSGGTPGPLTGGYQVALTPLP